MYIEVENDKLTECCDVIRKSFETVATEFSITPQNASRYVGFTDIEKLKMRFEMGERIYADYENGKIRGLFGLAVFGNGECELNYFCVLPEYRHCDIGSKMLCYAQETAKKLECEVMKLSIVEENNILRKWYEKHGFIHTNEIKFDFFPFTCGYMEKALN